MAIETVKRWLYASGALGAYHRLRNRNSLTVVMFHRILSTGDPRWATCDPDYTVSDEFFLRTVRFLKRHYNIVALGDLIAARHGAARLPPRALLVTFDDGWSDNLDHALPILRREGVPALMFVAADAVDRRSAVFQEELIAAWRAGRLSREDVLAMAREAGAGAQPMPGDGLLAVRRLVALLEQLPVSGRDRILGPYASRLGDGLRHMVSGEELLRLREGSVAIGLHGKTHTPLTRADDIDAELGEARRLVAGSISGQGTYTRSATMSARLFSKS